MSELERGKQDLCQAAGMARFTLVSRNAKRLGFWASDALIVIFHRQVNISQGSS